MPRWKGESPRIFFQPVPSLGYNGTRFSLSRRALHWEFVAGRRRGVSMRRYRWLRSFILLAVLAALVGQPLWPQRRNRNDPFGRPRTPLGLPEPTFPNRPSTTRKMLKASHQELQKEVTELADMTAALQDEISKSNEDELPLDALKKAEEIEKLARKIQNRIKNL